MTKSDVGSQEIAKHGWLQETFKIGRHWLDQANGWQRLWLVLSSLWILFISYKIASEFPGFISHDQIVEDGTGMFGITDGSSYCSATNSLDWQTTRENIWGFVGLYIPLLVVVPLLTYGLGVVCSWIVAGFGKAKNR